MKIKNIAVENFRSIESLSLNFGQRLTLLIGENGTGKTSLLDAIGVCLGAVATHLPNVAGIGFKPNRDLRMEKGVLAPYSYVSLTTTKGITWDRLLKRDKSKKTQQTLPVTHGVKALEHYLNENVIDPFNQQLPFALPLFVFYGVSRALLNIPLTRKGFLRSHSRFDALAGSLNADSRFKSAFVWFYNKENEEHRLQKELRDFDASLPELAAVRRAIEQMFPDLSQAHIRVNPLQFVVKQDEQFLNIDQLSDGYKTLLGMVIDLSARMAMANPNSLDPLQEEAIVMIDEVDLHLHPAWQKKVMLDFLRTFPNTQFIITTHSPFIVESLNNALKRAKLSDLLANNASLSEEVKNIYSLDSSQAQAYLMSKNSVASILNNELGLLDDKLLSVYNDINAIYDEMRDIEWHGYE